MKIISYDEFKSEFQLNTDFSNDAISHLYDIYIDDFCFAGESNLLADSDYINDSVEEFSSVESLESALKESFSKLKKNHHYCRLSNANILISATINL